MVSPGRLEEAILENHPLMKSTFCLLCVLRKNFLIILYRRDMQISSFTEYEIKLVHIMNSFENE